MPIALKIMKIFIPADNYIKFCIKFCIRLDISTGKEIYVFSVQLPLNAHIYIMLIKTIKTTVRYLYAVALCMIHPFVV